MADSEFQRPTLAENISMLRNDLFARLDVSDTLRRMDEDVRAKVYAAALHTVYGYIDYLAMNMLPDLCDESWLARHAAMKRCPRKGATVASGYMRWEGVSDGLKVTAGSVIQRDDLVQYTTTDDAISSGGVLRVPIACSSAGAVGNADDGTALILVTPVNGLPSSGVADTLTGGFDTEELETVAQIHSWFLEKVNRMIYLLEHQVTYSPRVKKIIEYMHQNYETDMGIEDIADEFGLHKVHLSRVFKEETGKSPNTYLNEIRIEKAKEMLKDPNIKIHDIIYGTGFNNPQSFYYIFKQVTGKTPGEFRLDL